MSGWFETFGVNAYHDLLHRIGHLIGHEIPVEAPSWLHSLLHVVLIWVPAALGLVVTFRLIRYGWRRCQRRKPESADDPVVRDGESIFALILRFTRREQGILIVLGAVSLPVLYATLELPKLIVNQAIDAEEHVTTMMGVDLDQTEHLFVLCALYLIAILTNGTIKFVLNIRKGRVGERMLRRLRLMIFRRWKNGAAGDRRGEVVPLIAQEVEPIGGFASDMLALPVFQGGTFLTILIFMFVQDPYLGAAALTLLPIQLAVIPRFQRKLNALARLRVREVRNLSGHLGDQAARECRRAGDVAAFGTSVRELEAIRLKIHRVKFLMKGINNFLSALTPFFFYSIGGYLVIEGRLTLGALVAVLAAYKDFSSPLRELFRYYQGMEDVRIRFEEILHFLGDRSLRTGSAG